MNSNSMKQRAGIGTATLIVLMTAGSGVTALETGTPDKQMVIVKSNDPDPWQQQIGDIVTLRAGYTETIPAIDGQSDDPAWAKAGEVTVPLAWGRGDVKEATLKAVYTEEDLILLVSWPDPTRDEQYHPWVWDEGQGRYVEGPQLEDALLVSIEGGCEWNPSLLAGQEFDFDGWWWLAARSNPVGQAVDISGGTTDHYVPNFGLKKYQSLSSGLPAWELKFVDGRKNILTKSWQDLRRQYRHPQSQFQEIYVGQQPDGGPDGNGQAVAFTERMGPPSGPVAAAEDPESGMLKTAAGSPAPVAGPVMVPQFRPIRLTGDAGNVAARGQWQDGRWTVEFKRALVLPEDTGDHSFRRASQFSIHAFDHTEDLDKSSSSWRILLEFEPAATGGADVLTTQNTP